MGYCFMTFEKIKTKQQMAGKYKHNFREIEVLNADPDKIDNNSELISLNGKTYVEAFEDRLKSLGYGENKKIRSNAVLGFEVVTTFSREDAKRVDLEQWKKDNVEWLKKTFNADIERYGNNVLSVMYHADEPGNVHCHAFIVPIDNKGNLNARYYVQNRQKLIGMQDSYAQIMEKNHGLKRGIKNSKATHQDIKRYYAALNMTIEKKLPEPEKNESIEDYYKRINGIYQNVSLKAMGLELKNKQLLLENMQIQKNMESSIRKEFHDKYYNMERTLYDLNRDYGPIETIRSNCDKYESLIEGIETNPNKIEITNLVNRIIENGNKEKFKKKNRYQQNTR